MVIAGNGQNAAIFRGAECIGVLDHIHAPIDSGPFAIPHRKYAVIFWLGNQMNLLRTPNRGGRKVFVHARLELNIMSLKVFPGFPDRLV